MASPCWALAGFTHISLSCARCILLMANLFHNLKKKQQHHFVCLLVQEVIRKKEMMAKILGEQNQIAV